MSVPVATILVVEDDPDIRQLISELMRKEGFAVEEAEHAVAMDDALARMRPDLIILDLMLPGEDGLSVCRRIRTRDALPILMLTAKSDEIDRVVGLEMGADDYLVKPFGPRELLARVRAVLRRGNPRPMSAPTRRFVFDRFVIDLELAPARRHRRRRTDAHQCRIRSPSLLRAAIASGAHARSDTRLDPRARRRSIRPHRRYAGFALAQKARCGQPPV